MTENKTLKNSSTKINAISDITENGERESSRGQSLCQNHRSTVKMVRINYFGTPESDQALTATRQCSMEGEAAEASKESSVLKVATTSLPQPCHSRWGCRPAFPQGGWQAHAAVRTPSDCNGFPATPIIRL